MADVLVELYNGTRLSFPEGTDPATIQRVAREQTMRFRAAENAPAGYEVVETYADGGRIVRNTETGRESYISDGSATRDPEQITRIRSREGRAGEVVSGQMAKDIVGGLPTGIVSAFKGVPVLRGYVEPIVAAGAKGIGAVQDILPEALGGGGAPSASQADIESLLRQAVTEREREAPIATAASRLGAGLATGYVAAPLAPALRGGAGLRMLQAGLYGGAGGATEGAIAGYGIGGVEGAKEEAAVGGAAGAVLGPLSVPLAAAGAAVYKNVLEKPVRNILQEIGFKGNAAQIAKDALAKDAAEAVQSAEYVGPYGSVGTLGPNAEGLIDYVANSTGEGATIVRRNLDETAAAAADDLSATLDDVLGAPTRGIQTQKADIMKDTAAARRELYGEAYDATIDPTSGAGSNVIGLFNRVSPSDLSASEELLREAGEAYTYLRPTRISSESLNDLTAAQRAGLQVRSLPDGGYEVQRVPSVAQIDYITRRLIGEAEALRRAGNEAAAVSKRNLAMQLRAGLDEVSPSYAAARAAGKDAIDQRLAADLGNDLLNPRVTREEVAIALETMDDVARKQLAQALRNRIDELSANARGPRRTAANVVEALAQMRVMNTRAVAEKLRMALGDQAADRIGEQIRTTAAALEQRALIAAGSRTFIRGQIDARVAELVGRPIAETIAQQGVTPTVTSGLLGMLSGPSQAQRVEAVGRELAPILTQRQTPEQLMATARNLEQMTPLIGQARERSAFLQKMLERNLIGAAASSQAAAPETRGLLGFR